MSGLIFDISRFRVDDGPGIRTAVFIKGCPLRCKWCHNPEGLGEKKDLLFYPDRCVLCRACESVCLNMCHIFGQEHTVNRNNCEFCGRCVDACPNNALAIAGKEANADEIIKVALKDKPFYGNDGGLTISGGEPMFNADFAISIAKKAKSEGLNVVLETSGYAKKEKLLEISQYVDLFLYDYKITGRDKHKEYTGVFPDIILSNLQMLDNLGAKINLRCPIIPGINDDEEHAYGIARVALSLKNITKVTLLPYHPLGINKNIALGNSIAHNDSSFADKSIIEHMKGIIGNVFTGEIDFT